MICFGHRGASGYEPENTLRSFKRAIEFGCDWIELDVYLADEHIVVIHDEDLSRTTNGRGRVSTSSFKYLRSLDAGKGEQIPTLEEVVTLVEHQCGINIELKGPGTAAAVGNFLAAIHYPKNEILISSFDHREVALMDSVWHRAALFEEASSEYVDRALALNAVSINLDLHLVTKSAVEKAHTAGLKVYVFTVNSPADLGRMKALAVDGFFSDFPDRVLAMRDSQ